MFQIVTKITFSYLIYQVKSNFRTAVTVPEKCWSRFRDILNDYCDKMKKSSTIDNIILTNPTSTTTTAESNLQQQQQPLNNNLK